MVNRLTGKKHGRVVKWRIRDIIDLEYFLHQDGITCSGDNQEELHARDRDIFLKDVQPAAGGDKNPDRQFTLMTWLNRRREEDASEAAVLPGAGVESLYGSLRVVFFGAGLVLGGIAGASFLTYTGDSPVNVFVYLAVFVFSQLLLLFFLLALFLYRFSRRSLLSSSILYILISRFMLRILRSARNHLAKRMSAARRSQAEFTFGAIAGKTRAYGILFFLPVFIMTQLFAIGFNLGLLTATLFKVITTDIAFGWQSTIQLSSAAVHALARNIALPWSWAVQGDAAFPSLAQIEGSRIILKEGIYHLSTPDLVSWWPFLCFAVAMYGLLPRFFLFLAGAALQRKLLGSLDFRQGIYEQLLLRMTTPLVSTRGRGVDDARPRDRETAPMHQGSGRSAGEGRSGARKLLVMIPDEIYDFCPRQEIESVVNSGAVYDIREILRINQDYASDRELFATLRNMDRMKESDILVIQEGWQPPIMEYIDFIRQVRKAVGDVPCIRIGLIGKPGDDTVFTPVKEENRKIWAQKITAMGDPCIYSEGLVSHAS
ncbi:MAG: DUF2868 domain-containing protein [Desulfobulbaceae bacterium]|nr:DUF2868 domain-containing protein [Desulfobulbaceae bacterium]